MPGVLSLKEVPATPGLPQSKTGEWSNHLGGLQGAPAETLTSFLSLPAGLGLQLQPKHHLLNLGSGSTLRGRRAQHVLESPSPAPHSLPGGPHHGLTRPSLHPRLSMQVSAGSASRTWHRGVWARRGSGDSSADTFSTLEARRGTLGAGPGTGTAKAGSGSAKPDCALVAAGAIPCVAAAATLCAGAKEPRRPPAGSGVP